MNSKFKGSILGLAYADALGAGYEFFKGTIGEEEYWLTNESYKSKIFQYYRKSM